ncbi:putative protein serine/threonine kinase [Scheffersomyces spartinae]|uniref:non-specific serine/threonine protein kinase n=1 Tax=Scheffersomyces spartinae TaxID=45513 RepID=A0A9P8AGJ1_9ASCO|nr:putative protein serine/threonine kinase [Scheffersomyces spartinae]KAG7192415.1 putative protein serine/threonine kinase [Scheffersomyces spartinae]
MSEVKYKFGECIGKGNFGDVFKATDKTTKKVYAIKVINLDCSEDMGSLIQEIRFLSLFRSPFITRYCEAFIDDIQMYVVMEYCGRGSCSDLLRVVKRMSETLAAFVIRETLKGLHYLHTQQKVHRDIKAANILVTDNAEVKVGDFGVSGEITDTHIKRKTFVGTPFWMAPEIIARKKYGGYDERVDIWSTGITTIELVRGVPPLLDQDPMKMVFQIPKCEPPILKGDKYSRYIKLFVKDCLKMEPKDRPTAQSLLRHPFIMNALFVEFAKLVESVKRHQTRNPKTPKVPRYKIPLDWVNEDDLIHHQKHDNPNWDDKRIEWDFETLKSLRQGPIGKQDYIDVKSSIGNGSNMQIDTVGVTLVALNSLRGAMAKAAAVNNNINSHNDKTSLVEPKSPRLCTGEVLYFCLQRVYLRAKSKETKRTVLELINVLLQYEDSNPGLSAAIVEEILKFGKQNGSSLEDTR